MKVNDNNIDSGPAKTTQPLYYKNERPEKPGIGVTSYSDTSQSSSAVNSYSTRYSLFPNTAHKIDLISLINQNSTALTNIQGEPGFMKKTMKKFLSGNVYQPPRYTTRGDNEPLVHDDKVMTECDNIRNRYKNCMEIMKERKHCAMPENECDKTSPM